MPTDAQRLAARERPPGLPVMRQRWSGLLFLHWPVEISLIRDRLPPGLHVDPFGGNAWLGVVPFFMDRVRPVGLPPLPWLSWFMELNVRTYVHDDAGNPGVWFFSLDCNQPLAVEIARRAFHLPYQHAAMASARSATQAEGGTGVSPVQIANRIDYRCRRKSCSREAIYQYESPTLTQPAVLGSLEWFLVERYLLFSANRKNELFQGRVHHTPYQIATGNCSSWSTAPLLWENFPEPAQSPPSILTAAPVDVEIFPLRRWDTLVPS